MSSAGLAGGAAVVDHVQPCRRGGAHGQRLAPLELAHADDGGRDPSQHGLGGGGQRPPPAALGRDERKAMGGVDDRQSGTTRGHPGQRAGLGRVHVQQVVFARRRHGMKSPEAACIRGRTEGASEREPMQRDTVSLQRRVDHRLLGAGHGDPHPVPGEARGQLENVLGHAAVRGLEDQQRAEHRRHSSAGGGRYRAMAKPRAETFALAAERPTALALAE